MDPEFIQLKKEYSEHFKKIDKDIKKLVSNVFDPFK
jgi:hypothetical protein|tara:strand:+ start:11 stop:118 length:108 start_codon:yes stop_codon:yes gene_type:complete